MHIIKKIIFIWSILCITTYTYAQQGYQLSQYIQSNHLLNPAFTGIENNIRLASGYRQQWSGWSGEGEAPSTIYAIGSTSIAPPTQKPSLSVPMRTGSNQPDVIVLSENKKNKLTHGIGGFLYSDRHGHFKRISIGTSYAVHYSLFKEHKIAAGVNLGVTDISIRQNGLRVIDEINDDTYNNLLISNNNKSILDMQMGLLWYNKKFFLGYSIHQLLRNRIFYEKNKINGQFSSQHNALAGLQLNIGNELTLQPTILLKYVKSAPITFDVGTKLVYASAYWGGIGVRNNNAIILFLGTSVKHKINITYSFDFDTSPIRKESAGGHEISLSTTIHKKEKDNSKYTW